MPLAKVSGTLKEGGTGARQVDEELKRYSTDEHVFRLSRPISCGRKQKHWAECRPLNQNIGSQVLMIERKIIKSGSSMMEEVLEK